MAVLKYSLLRLGVFAVVFFICINLNLGQFTVVFALLIGLVVSWAVAYLFFQRWRAAAEAQLAARFGKTKRSTAELADNAAEDEQAEQYHEDIPAEDTDPPESR